MNLTHEVLDTTIEKNVIEYEKAMYKAFSGSEIKTLNKIWEFDKANHRLKTIIPYESQKIFCTRLEGALVSAVAININIKETFQLEMMGFKVEKCEGVAEGLGLFNFPVLSNLQPMALLLKDYAFSLVESWGIKKMYGTCSEKKLRGYKLLGWVPIDKKTFLGETKYLLEIPIGKRD